MHNRVTASRFCVVKYVSWWHSFEYRCLGPYGHMMASFNSFFKGRCLSCAAKWVSFTFRNYKGASCVIAVSLQCHCEWRKRKLWWRITWHNAYLLETVALQRPLQFRASLWFFWPWPLNSVIETTLCYPYFFFTFSFGLLNYVVEIRHLPWQPSARYHSPIEPSHD